MLADTIPLYPLYALLFADTGLSNAQISTLFLIWSTVGLVAEVPTGALVDRLSRRAGLVTAGLLQAAGYVLWTAAPGYVAFAAGFVLWALGGAFASGALEALLYDGMASVGAEGDYPRVYGRVKAAGLLSQLPAAAAATALLATGGFPLVGWASVACCLAAAAFATRLPEIRPERATAAIEQDGNLPEEGGRPTESGYLAVLREGLTTAARSPAVRAAVVAVAVLGGVDGLEEYFPLLAQHWGVARSAIPLTMLGIPVAGAAGAALGGAAAKLRPRVLATLFAAAAAVFGGVALLQRPIGVAGIALAYGLYQVVLVATDAGLQARIVGNARATVTSVASFGTELTDMALYAGWAVDRPGLVAPAASVALAVAFGGPWLLTRKGRKNRGHREEAGTPSCWRCRPALAGAAVNQPVEEAGRTYPPVDSAIVDEE